MPPLTALLHTSNDALRLGRALEMLFPCDEILIVDHASTDSTRRLVRDYGARLVDSPHTTTPGDFLQLARHDWILCLQPTESISESLQATLFEWKLASPLTLAASAFSVFVRQETATGWLDIPAPETRLVPRNWPHWHGRLPVSEPSALALEGEILRFALP